MHTARLSSRSSLLRSFLSSLSTVLLLLLIPAARAEDQPKSKFDQLAEPIGKLVKLVITDKGLALDQASWDAEGGEQPANPPAVGAAGGVGLAIRIGGNATGIDKIFREFAQAAGPGGTSMSMGGNNRSYSYSGNDIALDLKIRPDRVQIQISEETEPGNDLAVTQDSKGPLRIITSNSKGDFLMLVQNAAGAVHVVHIAADKPSALRANSFNELYRTSPDYVEQTIFPSLTKLGVRVPPTRFSPAVIETVCSRLRPIAETDRKEFDALLAKLNDDVQATREATEAELTKKYARFAPLIADALKHPPSMEVQTRLGKVLTANAAAAEIDKFIASMKLLDDRDYLKALLDKTQGDNRAAVVSRLAQLLKDELDKMTPDQRKKYMDLIAPPPHSLPR